MDTTFQKGKSPQGIIIESDVWGTFGIYLGDVNNPFGSDKDDGESAYLKILVRCSTTPWANSAMG